ncbi:hypothetical protein ACFL1H_05005 [Nanoarchaeota archaeon]
MKKGYFFTMDALIALIILVVGFTLILSTFAARPLPAQTEFFSQDWASILTSEKLGGLQEVVFIEQDGRYEQYNPKHDNKKTVVELTGDILYHAYCNDINKETYEDFIDDFINEVIENKIPAQYGVEIKIDLGPSCDEWTGLKSVYMRESKTFVGLDESKLAISANKVIMGKIDSSNMWGPGYVEVNIWQ